MPQPPLPSGVPRVHLCTVVSCCCLHFFFCPLLSRALNTSTSVTPERLPVCNAFIFAALLCKYGTALFPLCGWDLKRRETKGSLHLKGTVNRDTSTQLDRRTLQVLVSGQQSLNSLNWVSYSLLVQWHLHLGLGIALSYFL